MSSNLKKNLLIDFTGVGSIHLLCLLLHSSDSLLQIAFLTPKVFRLRFGLVEPQVSVLQLSAEGFDVGQIALQLESFGE